NRILPAPPARGVIAGPAVVSPWAAVSTDGPAPPRQPDDVDDDGGLRRDQDPDAPDLTASEPALAGKAENGPEPDLDDDDAVQGVDGELEARMRRIARQAALDPDDGIAL
ncbi:hypothetical protein LTR94_030956, partial [Friedmanniomyces endolithicus]